MAKKVKVIVQDIVDNKILIKEGLSKMDEIVTKGAPYLSEGTTVQVIVKKQRR